MNLLPAPEIEQHGLAMPKSMVAAAKADGHLDERERGLVEAELGRLLVADDTSCMERACLDELARHLRLPEGLEVELERQALAA